MSPLIKQRVNQRSRDFYEWHYTSQMQTIGRKGSAWCKEKNLLKDSTIIKKAQQQLWDA